MSEPRKQQAPGRDREGLKRAAFETVAVHAGGDPDVETGAVVPPIYAVSTYAQDSVGSPRSGYVYGRGSNPTRTRLEQRLAALEGGSFACAFSSGMAAEDAVFRALCRPGDEVLIPTDVYGGTYRLLDKVFSLWGLKYVPVSISDSNAVRLAIKPGVTRLIWCETPTNPLLNVADIRQLATVAHEAGTLLVVDNTTKYIGGHSDVIGGATVTQSQDLDAAIRFHQNAAGAVPSPFDAWLVLRGSQTLAVRVNQQSDTALSLATEISKHPAVERVFYPGLDVHPGHQLASRQMRKYGGMISFTLAGGENAALQVCNSVKLFTLAESLGAVESLICHPLRMTHASAAGSSVAPPANLVRLSIGLEAFDDLASDLFVALDSVK